jgi:hypothetical protein
MLGKIPTTAREIKIDPICERGTIEGRQSTIHVSRDCYTCTCMGGVGQHRNVRSVGADGAELKNDSAR